MAQKILIMGLPGAGKTYLANELQKKLIDCELIHGEMVRDKINDWDFSYEGRIRQSHRLRELSDASTNKFVICDFVAPLVEMRNNFKADWIVWVDTIDKGRFEDTNKIFVPPEIYDFRVTEQNGEKWATYIAQHILADRRRPVFDQKKETVQLLGRWQPWHEGHRALFERALAKTGQVCIMIRDCQGWQDSNPFSKEQVKEFIKRDLDPLYQGTYEIVVVPNITNITYGRDVGYKIEQEFFDQDTHSKSASSIRKNLGI